MHCFPKGTHQPPRARDALVGVTALAQRRGRRNDGGAGRTSISRTPSTLTLILKVAYPIALVTISFSMFTSLAGALLLQVPAPRALPRASARGRALRDARFFLLATETRHSRACIHGLTAIGLSTPARCGASAARRERKKFFESADAGARSRS